MPQISERSKKLAGSGSKSKFIITRQPQHNLNSALTERIDIELANDDKNKMST
jgi:hypothetical protein